MKKWTLFALSGLMTIGANAQTPVSDSVSLGTGYVNQVWYSLETGQQTAIPKTDWDIAFPTSSFSVAVRINDGGGVHLWKYPNGDQTSWNSIDTNGLANNWVESHNSETDWDQGAFNDHATGGQFDYGWGSYNVTNHHLTANSVFIIQLSDGSFQKLMIDELDAVAGVYTFKHADLDGSNEVSETLTLSSYSTKNFVYYTLSDNQFKDLEPAKTAWDLLFTQYTSFIPAGPDTVAYPVTGIVTNWDEGVIKATGVDAATYADYQNHPWDSSRNVIGYDWKTYNMTAGEYVTDDSTVFFLLDKSESIWKLVFTGFGGATTGTSYFTKEKLHTTAIHDINGTQVAMSVYPNPATNGTFNLALNLNANLSNSLVQVQIYDQIGRLVYQKQDSLKQGMNVQTLSTKGWAAGTYFVNVKTANGQTTQKIIIQ